jgi:type IV secretion system protein VirD4
MLFLGGKGEDTTKYVSNDLLGKATIDTVSYGSSGSAKSLGANGYSSNEQKTGRNLLDETEVSRLADDECIVSIRGLNPFRSPKYNPAKHPNYRYLADSNPANVYRFRRGINIENADIQYVTLDLEEEISA